ncbi:MAG: hypothetical protein O9289_05900 [Rhodobacteraceae bacterium]|jgi:hypothetical protein|nr:hypothetical protein [Paracoccaceae bacterium]MCZ8082720.1 hypothetical protein [Paracoccaceae bacterium]
METRPASTSRRPLEKETILKELKEVLLGNACQIVVSIGRDEPAEAYLGISLEEYSLGSMPGSFRNDLAAIDLTKFYIAHQVSAAYDFALQQGSTEARTSFGEDDWNDLAIFVAGAARCSFGGEPTPLADEDSVLRRTLDMALARMNLDHGHALTIRELALLADIGEGAVRSALSAEGIKTEGKPAQVSAEIAEPWLRRRRGFVPTLVLEGNTPNVTERSVDTLFVELPFEVALTRAIQQRSESAALLAKRAGVEVVWLEEIMAGHGAACEVASLRALASALGADVPAFVGRAVEALLRKGAP